MGFFDFFKSGPSKNAILAQVRKAKEVYAQPEYRRMAMDKLIKWGNDESLVGLLERFCVVVQSPHWDEEEKRWLVEEYIKLGTKVEPILRDFILKKNEINYALMAYRQIVDQRAYQQILIDALKSRPPSDHRSVQAKQEIIAAINELHDENFIDLILPYFHDHSDDVQCAAIDALSSHPPLKVTTSLIDLLKSDTHSARVLRAAANVLVTGKIPIGDNVKLSEVVAEDFAVKSGELVRLQNKES